MNKFTKIIIALAVFFGVLAIVIALQPAAFKVSRTATINAAPDVVFAQVNDLHNWNNWSPWAKLDPEQKVTFAGPDAGTGAAMSWDGNSDVGRGIMTITDSRANELIVMRLDFHRPMEATNTSEFTFTPADGGTSITWSMIGHKNFAAKAIGLVMDCNEIVGGYFEQGLNSLKMLTEVHGAI